MSYETAGERMTDAELITLVLTEARTRLAYGRAYDADAGLEDTYAKWDAARVALRTAVDERLEQETR